MPKFGLKCFLGSFVFSLVAVVAATRAYLYLTVEPTEEEQTFADIKAQNIKLFANNEEKEDILAKYGQTVEQSSGDVESINESSVAEAAVDGDVPADILFAPSEDTFSVATKEQTFANEDVLTDEIAVVDETTEENKDSLQIVDAAEATMFEIPLTHGFSASESKVTVSKQATNTQVALADESVKIENLGVDVKKASKVDEPPSLDADDDPWEVAEVANKNITRNQNAETVKTPVTGNSVPYKMQKNILIPIPDEIANDKNLTPQFSSSAENIKLEEELRRKHGRAPISQSVDETTTEEKLLHEDIKSSVNGGGNSADSVLNDEVATEDEKSLTDSIAAWFSSGRKKSGSEDGDANDKAKGAKTAPAGRQESSLFRKLLGLSAANKGNIAPTELKLSFQANRAEISGQTLEWIKAFSENVVNYDDVAIEIRLDRSASYELQQKRLKLLYKILANNGVEYRKINIIFTDREPNSFIIRNVRYVTKEEKAEMASKEKSPWY